VGKANQLARLRPPSSSRGSAKKGISAPSSLYADATEGFGLLIIFHSKAKAKAKAKGDALPLFRGKSIRQTTIEERVVGGKN